MALLGTRVTADVTPTVLATNAAASSEGDFRDRSVLLRNVTGTAPVFLGGADVTTGGGFQWDASAGTLEVVLEPGESLYGIVAAVAQTIHVLSSGR